MSCQCGHQPWDHGTVTYPRYCRPCERLVCCDKPLRFHDGVAHRPQYCSCRDLRLGA